MMEAVIDADQQPATGSENRLKSFMELHRIQTSGEMAQVFRVTQDTTSRWIKNADSKPLEETMQGPALILFELMENGLQTKELIAVKAMAAVAACPSGIEDLNMEEKWTVTLSNRARLGVRIENLEGYFIVVHSRWLKERMAALNVITVEDKQKARQKRAQSLFARYEGALSGLAELPR